MKCGFFPISWTKNTIIVIPFQFMLLPSEVIPPFLLLSYVSVFLSLYSTFLLFQFFIASPSPLFLSLFFSSYAFHL
jgi:hypothetical protein